MCGQVRRAEAVAGKAAGTAGDINVQPDGLADRPSASGGDALAIAFPVLRVGEVSARVNDANALVRALQGRELGEQASTEEENFRAPGRLLLAEHGLERAGNR
jgi:hypothetical protein